MEGSKAGKKSVQELLNWTCKTCFVFHSRECRGYDKGPQCKRMRRIAGIVRKNPTPDQEKAIRSELEGLILSQYRATGGVC